MREGRVWGVLPQLILHSFLFIIALSLLSVCVSLSPSLESERVNARRSPRLCESDPGSKEITSVMECFNTLLLKLREVHEREVEGWQVKTQELANKKGCDTKRMEELFTKNQQMKEQQRVLVENIKTLENRLRAGLCDRCTVTQEVAKRRQQEFEATQMQSLQHISLMAGEMNNLKKENKRLREELRNFRAALDRGHSDHSSNSSTTTEVKTNSSPDLSPSSGPVALVNMASNPPAEGNVAVKTEADQRSEESEHRQLRGMNGCHFESYKPVSWKTDHRIGRLGERRAQSVEGLDQRSSIPPQGLLKNSSSSTSGEVKPIRHVLHAPVPCRPQPSKSSSLTLHWPLSGTSDWVSAAAPETGLAVQPSPKPNLSRFPKLIPTSPHTSSRRQVFGSPWHKQSTPHPPAKEPTVVFRLTSLSEHVENQSKPQEKKDILPSKTDRVSGEGVREVYEGPLDLSDRGKSKPGQMPRDDSSIVLQDGERVKRSPDKDGKANPSALGQLSSTSPVSSPSCSSTLPVQQQEGESPTDYKHKQAIKEQEQIEEVNGKTDQSNGKKVPVLTISLRPAVVMLENLNSALQEPLLSNAKSSSVTVEPGSSTDEEEEESVSELENNQGCKRKRASVETETDRDSETDNLQQERKLKITARTEENPCKRT